MRSPATGVVSMSANPMECRRRALSCAELANDAKNEKYKRSMIAIAKNWIKLAEELESAQPSRERAAMSTAAVTPLFR